MHLQVIVVIVPSNRLQLLPLMTFPPLGSKLAHSIPISKLAHIMVLLFGRFPVQTSAGTLIILMEDILLFPQSLQESV
jgi:hypothetical protein